jgi:hypothetical protein
MMRLGIAGNNGSALQSVELPGRVAGEFLLFGEGMIGVGITCEVFLMTSFRDV